MSNNSYERAWHLWVDLLYHLCSKSSGNRRAWYYIQSFYNLLFAIYLTCLALSILLTESLSIWNSWLALQWKSRNRRLSLREPNLLSSLKPLSLNHWRIRLSTLYVVKRMWCFNLLEYRKVELLLTCKECKQRRLLSIMAYFLRIFQWILGPHLLA